MYNIRDIEPMDKDFLFDSWLKSWRTQRAAGVIPNNLYYTVTRSVIENLVGRGATIKVACSIHDPSHIYGYICFETMKNGDYVVHYLYVKDPYIKLGVADGLMKYIPTKPFITFAYKQVKDAVAKKFKYPRGWLPEIARRK